MISNKSPRRVSCKVPVSIRGDGAIVTYYRLYLLSQSGDHFIGFEEFEADDDVSAARLAESHRGIHPLELWCGKRKVKSFPAKGVMTK